MFGKKLRQEIRDCRRSIRQMMEELADRERELKDWHAMYKEAHKALEKHGICVICGEPYILDMTSNTTASCKCGSIPWLTKNPLDMPTIQRMQWSAYISNIDLDKNIEERRRNFIAFLNKTLKG